MIVSGGNVFKWFLVPVLNFFFWLHYSQRNVHLQDCRRQTASAAASAVAAAAAATAASNHGPAIALPCPEEATATATSSNSNPLHPTPTCRSPALAAGTASWPHVTWSKTVEYEPVWQEHLAPINFRAGVLRFYHPKRDYTAVLKRTADDTCTSLYFQFSNTDKIHDYHDNHCVAVVRAEGITGAWNAIRFDIDLDEVGLERGSKKTAKMRREEPEKFAFEPNAHNRLIAPTSGFIHAVPGDPGREKVYDKLGGFLRNFHGPQGITAQLEEELASNGVKAGDDLIVMVVNEGEIDLFMNFACSCQQMNITIRNLLVFAASPEIVTVIESAGAMGIYHPGYASVSRHASNDYMDRTFVDMMWYKAFSVYLILRMGINVLFQDADLVWFRDPFPYFKQVIADSAEKAARTGSHFEAFFADDGQRSLRYAPFYANSGFYYLLANERSVYFTWSIMISFDLIQVSGSHQNVFTFKLIEATALSATKSKLLPLEQFPTGITYHHDHLYMDKLRAHTVRPYNYHMCWTQGKKDKLKYFKDVSMWYLTPVCSEKDALAPRGKVFGATHDKERKGHDRERRWQHLADMCCQTLPGGDYNNAIDDGKPLPKETRKY